MPASRAPWWLYVVAASFCSCFVLYTYSQFWGPEEWGCLADFSGDRLVVRDIYPNLPGARAGLEPGDRILAVDGQSFRSDADLLLLNGNSEVGSPRRLDIERGDKRIQLVVTPRQLSWKHLTLERLGSLAFYGVGFICLLLALVVAFNKPHDAVALVGAWFLASWATNTLDVWYGFGAAWRHLPAPLGLLVWIGFVGGVLSPPLFFTFCSVFPRKLFRSPWPLRLAWVAGVVAAFPLVFATYRMLYQPGRSAGIPQQVSRVTILWLLLGLGGLVALVANYSRLDDLNERRRVRVLVSGTLVGVSGILIIAFLPTFFPHLKYSFLISVFVGCAFLSLAFPLSFAYALLRHRLFDFRLILRQGLRYALARRFVLAAVPILAAILLLDLWLHADQPLAAILRARGWMYAALAALAAVAYSRRQTWLEALDRRFFREQYDARRLLCEVVEEVHAARSFEQEAPQVTARIESALHPEFVALLVSEPPEKFYRILAASPAETGPPPLQKESKLLSLVRLLGKPLEVPQIGTGWMQKQLPHEETEYLRRGRIDLLVPVATDPERTEVLLVLGAKRSEQPYSSEDQDLLVAIAASLAILLERPATAAPLPRKDIFEECPQCGSCYDSGSSQCAKEGARLLPVILPRLLESRYLLERRLGRGGMGTVYAASDALLERRVAVKVIREDLVGSAEAAERFRREARAAASFAHPNVVTVYDFGVASGTRAFLVMELLEGSTLRERLKAEKRLATKQLVSIVGDVCAALGAAHRRHLVHRDLKPENIFLVNAESGEVAKILDFGLAKFVVNSSEDRTVDTATGAILGTVRYMSPEQRDGQLADQAWDIWALAVTTYEMLTGYYPFERGARDRFAVEPVVPFTPIVKYIPGEVGAWQSLFEHSFAREMSVRPHSVEAFLSELRGVASKTVA